MFAGAFSLNDEDIRTLDRHTPGIQQEASATDAGYGYLYYALVRMLRPQHVLVIGSGFGFSPAVMAKALEQLGRGQLTFVDPSMDRTRNGENAAHGGQGSWDTDEALWERFLAVGVTPKTLTHYRETNREFFARYEERKLPPIDLALIDGAHDGPNALFDLNATLAHLQVPGYLVLHDALHFLNHTNHMGVTRVVEAARTQGLRVVTFPGSAGLALIEVSERVQITANALPPPSVVKPAAVLVVLGFLCGKLVGL